MKTPEYDVVILSDLHLGSETSKAHEALRLIHSLRFRRLILLGDIFCDLNFRRLNKEHWRFLSHIRKLSNPKRGVEVIWVEGNHDYGLAEMMAHLVGVDVYEEYAWESAGEKHLAIHGHQFDDFITRQPLFMGDLATQLYLTFQKFDRGSRRLSCLLDLWNTRWRRLTHRVAEGALDYARAQGATRIYCGHTHEAIVDRRNGIHYYNAGGWATFRPTYITINGHEIVIRDYSDTSNGNSKAVKRSAHVTAPQDTDSNFLKQSLQ